MSARSAATNPRKWPRQARSRATVDALPEAAAQVLQRHEYAGATTARIAERAGVSIGSFNQYFPTKEALLAEPPERCAQDTGDAMDRAADASRSLEDGLHALIRVALERIAPVVHRVLMEQAPHLDRARAMDGARRRVSGAIERLLRRHVDQIGHARDPAEAAVIVATALEALAHKAVAGRRELLASGAIQRQMFEVAAGYLLRPAH